MPQHTWGPVWVWITLTLVFIPISCSVFVLFWLFNTAATQLFEKIKWNYNLARLEYLIVAHRKIPRDIVTEEAEWDPETKDVFVKLEIGGLHYRVILPSNVGITYVTPNRQISPSPETSVTPEIRTPGVPIVNASAGPKCQLTFFVDNVQNGSAFRVEDYLVFTRHQLEWYDHAENVQIMGSMSRQLMNFKDLVKDKECKLIFTSNPSTTADTDIDTVVFLLTTSMWSKIGVEKAKVTDSNTRPLDIYWQERDMWKKSFGPITQEVPYNAMLVYHDCSTLPGSSGSPLVTMENKNKVVAMHIGNADREGRVGRVNYCILISHLLERIKEAQEELIPDGDIWKYFKDHPERKVEIEVSTDSTSTLFMGGKKWKNKDDQREELADAQAEKAYREHEYNVFGVRKMLYAGKFSYGKNEGTRREMAEIATVFEEDGTTSLGLDIEDMKDWANGRFNPEDHDGTIAEQNAQIFAIACYVAAKKKVPGEDKSSRKYSQRIIDQMGLGGNEVHTSVQGMLPNLFSEAQRQGDLFDNLTHDANVTELKEGTTPRVMKLYNDARAAKRKWNKMHVAMAAFFTNYRNLTFEEIQSLKLLDKDREFDELMATIDFCANNMGLTPIEEAIKVRQQTPKPKSLKVVKLAPAEVVGQPIDEDSNSEHVLNLKDLAEAASDLEKEQETLEAERKVRDISQRNAQLAAVQQREREEKQLRKAMEINGDVSQLEQELASLKKAKQIRDEIAILKVQQSADPLMKFQRELQAAEKRELTYEQYKQLERGLTARYVKDVETTVAAPSGDTQLGEVESKVQTEVRKVTFQNGDSQPRETKTAPQSTQMITPVEDANTNTLGRIQALNQDLVQRFNLLIDYQNRQERKLNALTRNVNTMNLAAEEQFSSTQVDDQDTVELLPPFTKTPSSSKSRRSERRKASTQRSENAPSNTNAQPSKPRTLLQRDTPTFTSEQTTVLDHNYP